MTDKEIKSALEGAILNSKKYDSKVWSIEVYKLENALDLINRLQAENERLEEVNNSFTDIGKLYSEIKTEAYKECIEKVEKLLFSISIDGKYFTGIHKHSFDNLLKELVGEDNA